MNDNEAKKAGELSVKETLTTFELELVLQYTSGLLSFLEGKGKGWTVAKRKLTEEVARLTAMKESRKPKPKG